ncbi:hypothetical protein [Aeoliella mucimassa]|uniref:Uncharacterized protein n=1 Tax=Aeoliella mucimassa TaxID=2527972 RepID=A0A518AJV0_9BACT|nr:hypothetical protein [Aeoliella mucimassa]QDU55009.1 hypothetical protein Pan181_11940 [Aeoliella mucimassa]
MDHDSPKGQLKAYGGPVAAMAWLLLVSVGCDPVQRVEQTVVLKVSEFAVESELGANPLTVTISEYYELSDRERELESYNPERGKQLYPWTPRVEVDDSGSASITYGVTAIDSTSGSTPPESRYPITNKTFRVKVQSKDGKSEELLLPMKVGESVTGKTFQVVVESLSKAKYVDPK